MIAKGDWEARESGGRSEETDERDEGTRQDVRKMLMASMKKEEEKREERVRVAPNMGAGRS